MLPISTDHAEQFAWGRSRFLEEANTLKKLNGTPSIVGVHDFFEAKGTAYMVMDLIKGETLTKRLIREERLAAGLVEPLLFPCWMAWRRCMLPASCTATSNPPTS